MRKIYIALALFLTLMQSHAQNIRPVQIAVGPAKQVVVADIREDFHPDIQLLEAPAPDGQSEKSMVERLKTELAARYGGSGASVNSVATAPSPWMGDNFRSNNVINGVPNDNDMAISNGGSIVSVINSNIYMHQENGTSLISNLSLDAWAQPLGLTGDKYDPRALYDPIHDRFVVVCLNGTTDSTSYMIVGFSQTNDPTGSWNLYALPGDPRDDSLWTDYPIMALTSGELFLTANLLYNDQPWQTGFQRSLCWQIDLDSAYAGATMTANLWDSVYFGGRPVRNLCPIQGGSAPAGPNIYLLSNRNLTAGNDTVWIMEITDSIGGNPVMNINYAVSNQSYALPPNAIQQYNQAMATNDARWLDGFMENGVIQFVGNSLDTATGRSGIYHGMISGLGATPTVTGKIIGNVDGSYGYPGIAWFGQSPSSHEALIGLNFTGPNAQNHPGCGAIYYDGNGDYSPLVRAKSGLGYINVLQGTERWGDYMGVQLRYNQPSQVWIAGTFGQSSHNPATWIAEFHHPSIVGQDQPASEPTVFAFPNPHLDMFKMELELKEDEFIRVTLMDVQGRLVRELLADRAKAGKSSFVFSTQPLSAGTYLLQVQGSSGTFESRVIQKQ